MSEYGSEEGRSTPRVGTGRSKNLLMVGRTLQRYRLVEEVGHGGMAVVFRGLDEGLEREVAVKLLHPHLASRIEHRRRLIREAKAVARLKHPNILEIFDFSGEDSPEAFLVTEFIRGTTLKTFAVDRAFDPPELAAACVYVLAGALVHAHEQGIIHRDLKPENVMIQRAGALPVLKLMDFGIAQILDRDERMTVTGALMGSPAHMAPEIIDGEEADERSDIFSLGTILYWLVTGQLPFDGNSPGALLKQVLSGEFTDPRVLKPAVSDRLAEIIARSLARNRSERIQTAGDFQKQLASALADAGFPDPVELVTQFLATPEETARTTRTTVVTQLMAQGQAAATKRKTGKALAAYSRVIAIVPGTPEAGAARQAIDRMNSRRRWRRRLAIAAALTFLVSAGAAAKPWLTRWLTQAPVVVAVTEPPKPVAPTITPTPDPIAPTLVDPAAEKAAIRLANPPRVEPPRLVARLPPQHPLVEQATATPPPLVEVFVNAAAVGDVFIDGVRKGWTKHTFWVPAGKHTIEVRSTAGCCEPFTTESELVPGTREEIRARLEPLPARVVLHVDGPPDTAILFDDQVRRAADINADKPLLVGIPAVNGEAQYKRTVLFRLQHEGYRDLERTIEVRAGQAEDVRVKMEPQG